METGLNETNQKQYTDRMIYLGETIRKYMNTHPALDLKDLALVLYDEVGEDLILLLAELRKLKAKEKK